MRGGRMEEVQHIWLTASGGPFFKTPQSEFALHHRATSAEPSHLEDGKTNHHRLATLMNKGFEVIEACRLFDVPPSRVEVMCTRNLRFIPCRVRGWSILAQFSVTDMRLLFCTRLLTRNGFPATSFPGHELTSAGLLPADMRKFKCLGLAYEAAEAVCQAVALNAADEVAVASFLDGEIGFDEIPRSSRTCFLQQKLGKWNL